MSKTPLQTPQHQNRKPGLASTMEPPPVTEDALYRPSGKLKGKKALITGGDSGIGAAVAILFAKEGAEVGIGYFNETGDARKTRDHIQDDLGGQCLLLPGDISHEDSCNQIVETFVETYGHVDILVNNAGEHYVCERFEDISSAQLEKIFRINFFSMVYLSQAALKSMKPGGTIINTASVTAYAGSPHLIDYASSKGAIVTFTRSLALSLADRNIRVNGVAPGPIWTPLIPSSFSPDDVSDFGKNTALGRAGQPAEVAPCYVFLASEDSRYMTGQILHPNGGRIING